jgi:hypothetical protein
VLGDHLGEVVFDDKLARAVSGMVAEGRVDLESATCLARHGRWPW